VSSISVRGLVVRYGRLVAVRETDFDVGEGQVTVLLGANGAGKSSTLNAICGAVRPAGGTVTFGGRDITRWPPHRVARLGLVQVPEGRHIIAPLSVEDNLLLGAYRLKSRDRRRELLRTVYDMFPILAERAGSPGGLLSGGEQQMLAFGRALMADPSTVLLDEPSMGLAPAIVDQVMASVRDIASRGLSVLMVEQNAAAALEVASAAYVLEQGEIVLAGSADEVRRHPVVLRAFLGLAAEIESDVA
jgi:branched-chain amino acid transport system ATP-binding protein